MAQTLLEVNQWFSERWSKFGPSGASASVITQDAAHLNADETANDSAQGLHQRCTAGCDFWAGLHNAHVNAALMNIWPNVRVIIAAELNGCNHEVVEHILHIVSDCGNRHAPCLLEPAADDVLVRR